MDKRRKRLFSRKERWRIFLVGVASAFDLSGHMIMDSDVLKPRSSRRSSRRQRK